MKVPVDTWHRPPIRPRMASDEIHVWRFDLELPEVEMDRRLGFLSIEEQERANCFVFKKHRDFYIAARGALRQTLGLYLHNDPATLQFSYASHGKPFLRPEYNPQNIRFNVTHSDGIALLALAVGCEVGIDIERVRTDFPYSEIAQRFFSAAEYAAFCATEPALRCATFFNYWTHKEAFIKAIGVGLSIPLNQFEVSLTPNVPAKLLSTTAQTPHHTFRALSPRVGYVGALAVIGRCTRMQLWSH